MPESDDSKAFRRQATVAFRVSVVAMLLLSCGMVAGGWWIGRWWGLAIGLVVGVVFFGVSMVMAGFLYAMTQDSA